MPVVRPAAVVAALSLAATATVACTQPLGPARTEDDYELKAANTAEAVLSALRTAELATDVAVRGRAFPPYVSVLLGEAESDADGAVSTFEKVQPPDSRSDRLRSQLGDLTSEATDALSALRITARRADLDALGPRSRDLEGLADRLDAFADEHG
jgi:hypothetical protein